MTRAMDNTIIQRPYQTTRQLDAVGLVHAKGAACRNFQNPFVYVEDERVVTCWDCMLRMLR